MAGCSKDEGAQISSDDEAMYVQKLEMEVFEGKEIEIGLDADLHGPPGKSRAAETVCLEPGCNFKCKRIPRLREHLASIHNFKQPLQSFEFKNEEEFRSWLSKIENENHCSFMRRRGWQKNKIGSKSSCFYCNRGGAYTSNASKKQSKQQGSCKTGVECTSSLKVSVWSQPHFKEKVQVEAYLQHYGHNFELGHTRIHLHDRKEIEMKLKSGVSRHKILDEIRGSLDQTSDLSRRHLISLQDIYNIEKRCGIIASRGRYCSEAGITAQAWIEGMQQSEDNPVLLIKYQQEAASEKYKSLADDDFLLVLQTPLQAKMLQKYGPRQFMCIDVTQGSLPNEPNETHGFLLFALEVLIPTEEDGREPYPVAWCVSNRKDTEVLRIFFECVKDNLSGLTLSPAYLFIPSVGVTGDDDWFDIWMKTFGAGPRKLISSWHVVEEWRERLQVLAPAVYTSPSERERVLGNLETVIRETSAEHFVQLLDECVGDLNANPLAKTFGSYISDSYTSQAELWASAYRTEAANRADMHLDAFHGRLSKHIYHEALKRKQLDVLVKTLMKYTRDNVLSKLRNLHKGKSEFHLRSWTAKSHKESLEFPLEHVKPAEDDSHQWNVMSIVKTLEGDSHHFKQLVLQNTVKVEKEKTCTARTRCSLRCSSCLACPHQMNCTCQRKKVKTEEVSSLSEQVMCVHMHQVCRFLWERRKQTIDSLLQAPTIMMSHSKANFEWVSAVVEMKPCSDDLKMPTEVVTSQNSDDVVVTVETNERAENTRNDSDSPKTETDPMVACKEVIIETGPDKHTYGKQGVKSASLNNPLVASKEVIMKNVSGNQRVKIIQKFNPFVAGGKGLFTNIASGGQRVKLLPTTNLLTTTKEGKTPRVLKVELADPEILFIPASVPVRIIRR